MNALFKISLAKKIVFRLPTRTLMKTLERSCNLFTPRKRAQNKQLTFNMSHHAIEYRYMTIFRMHAYIVQPARTECAYGCNRQIMLRLCI